MWTRREVVAGGALGVLFINDMSPRTADAAQAPHSLGCILADADLNAVYPPGTDTRLYARGDEAMIPRSGDVNFDIALAETLAMVANTFGVLPGFAYYNDVAANAFATRRCHLDYAKDGTVLMGINFLRRLRAGLESPEVAVAAIASHEFAHILQYKLQLFDSHPSWNKVVKPAELQADCLAGYFAGLRKLRRPTYPAAVVAMTIYDQGDTDYGNPDHHGTPYERGQAVVKGFEAAFREKKSLNDFITESTAYVLDIARRDGDEMAQ
jgi:hypothetical protein